MKIAFIYMASGFGRRFGENKLLIDFCEKPLYLHGLSHLQQAKLALEKLEYSRENENGRSKRLREEKNQANSDKMEKLEIEILVVSQYEQIREQVRKLGIRAIKNLESKEGISASIRLGTQNAREDTDIFLYFVADQPYMKADVIEAFVSGFLESKKGIGAVSFHGKRRNPAAFLRKYREELLLLCGDRGGSHIIRQHLDDLWMMEVEEEMVRDIDTKEDLE